MLSRIFWISFAGIALIAGMALQDGGIFSLADRTPDHAKAEQTIEARIETAIDRSFDKMHVTGSDGEEIDVPATTKPTSRWRGSVRMIRRRCRPPRPAATRRGPTSTG